MPNIWTGRGKYSGAFVLDGHEQYLAAGNFLAGDIFSSYACFYMFDIFEPSKS
jgi:hypothetical protein